MAIRFPLGVDSFAEIRQNGNYYVDKTKFISELLKESFEVNLITRPRRFGKTLTMSMLDDFFDISRDSGKDFEGLAIRADKALCAQWMNQWPTIFFTMKSVEGGTFAAAYAEFKSLLSDFCVTHLFLGKSEKVTPVDRALFQRFLEKNAADDEIRNAFFYLTRMMSSHYGKPVILLLDEYDVPLAKANDKNYYPEMLEVLRALFGKSLKTNPYLKFAVITGCLKMAKESIFTGTNHLVSNTISQNRFAEDIGFTEADVQKILKDTGFQSHSAEIKKWYDGYRFGDMDIYCPWDVLNYLAELQINEQTQPGSYWANTSDNSIIRKFIERKDLWKKYRINIDFETLLAGGCIIKSITENLTYDMVHSSADNLWSLLYLTGYLTRDNEVKSTELENGKLALKIPNEEIRNLFNTTVKKWLEDHMSSMDKSALFDALWGMDEQKASKLFTEMMFQTISYHDYKEDFYHAFVVGALSFEGYPVKSNDEEGEGRPDIVLRDELQGRAMVIEIKRAKTFEALPTSCQEALSQIEKRRYVESIETEYQEIYGYGIAFYNKRCMVKARRFRWAVTEKA